MSQAMPRFAQSEPVQSTSQAHAGGASDFSRTILPGQFPERKAQTKAKQSEKPGNKYKKADEGRKITTSATPSESDTDTASKRTHKQAIMTYTHGAIVTETPQETEKPVKKLHRLPVRSTEISLHTPTVTLDPEGTKLRYFIGSSTGTVAQGTIIPGDETNWFQDIIDLNARNGVPTITQCGHVYTKNKHGKPAQDSINGTRKPASPRCW